MELWLTIDSCSMGLHGIGVSEVLKRSKHIDRRCIISNDSFVCLSLLPRTLCGIHCVDSMDKRASGN